MGDGDELLGALPGGAAHQVHAAVLGDDVVGKAAGIGDDVAGGKQRVDAGFDVALFVREGGCETDERLAAAGQGRALQKVQLAARAADLPRAGAFGVFGA